MRIGVDIMGGDFAPIATTLGTILASKELPQNVRLVLFGDEVQIREIFEKEKFDYSKIEIVHAPEVIGMGEHPAKAFSQKPNSSIALGFQHLVKGEIDSFASAGNTGAMLVGCMYTVKSIPGIIRPTITTSFPKLNGNHMVVADVGINVDSKPDVLYQYGTLASIYSETVYGIKNPKVALLNIGEEEEKGNLLTKSAFELMKGTKDFNFVGNVEGHHLFSDNAPDVVITDGFTGNVLLKTVESFYSLLKRKNINDEYFEKLNFENYGGTPVLGINSTVLIGHGVSNDIAIKNMILHSKNVLESKLTEKIKEAFK